MKIKSIVFMIIITIILLFGSTIVQAAGTSLTATSYDVKEGESVTINVSFTAAAWNLTVSGDKITGDSYSSNTSDLSETTTTKSFTIDTSTAGTYTVTLSGDITDANGVTTQVNKSITIKVAKREEIPSDPTPDPVPEPQPDPQPKQPTVTEPKFTSVNRTMYATGDINLRASWSTSSAATQITKGTELTITGTSTERVNGYIWYRVNYNGTTKYVASNLLTNTNPTEEEEKSNNNLKTLVVKGFSISPSFKAETLEYSLQVTDDTEKLDITAEAENEKATVEIEGNEVLAEGENLIKIIVTAEDGTTKTYTLKAIKQEGEAFGLQSLTIKGTNISSQFSTDLYEYEIKVKDVNALDIEAIATEEDAIIEILGNEDLQEGENIITIIVKSSNEEQTVTYQITAIKTVAVIAEPEQNTIDFKYILYGIIGAVILIALIIVVGYTIKQRKEGMYEEDETDDFEYYPEDLPERENEYYPGDLPEKNSYFEDQYSEEPYEEVDDEEVDDEEYEEIEEEYNDNQEENNNYFLDDPEDWDDGKSNKRGKHF